MDGCAGRFFRSSLLTLILIALPNIVHAQRVLITYYSQTGNTEKLANAIAEGAKSVRGVDVVVKKIADVDSLDLRKADAIIVGSPTYWSNMAPEVKTFIDSWPDLVDKTGAAFATGGSPTGGKEHVVTSIVLAMLSHGMIVVGPLFNDGALRFGANGVTTLPEGRALGERVASLVKRHF